MPRAITIFTYLVIKKFLHWQGRRVWNHATAETDWVVEVEGWVEVAKTLKICSSASFPGWGSLLVRKRRNSKEERRAETVCLG